jgi:hypothetical protein
MNLMPSKLPEYQAPLQIETGSSGKGGGESCGLGNEFFMLFFNVFFSNSFLDLCCGCFECDSGCCA